MLKKRDALRTQDRILAAAQSVFSSRSYPEATIRDIAAVADVNTNLINRYFGSKLELYETVLRRALDVRFFIDTGKRRDFGARIVQRIIAPDIDVANPFPMLMFGASDTQARETALRALQEEVLAPLAEWMGGANAVEKAAQIMALTAGFSNYRILLPLQPFRGSIAAHTRRWLENALQQIIDTE